MLARVKRGATCTLYWRIDGYPAGAAPTLALTLLDGSTATYTLTPVAGTGDPVGPVAVSAIGADRQTLTLASAPAGEDITRDMGAAWLLADGGCYPCTVGEVRGTTAILTEPVQAGVSPGALAWATYAAAIGPEYEAGDGPTATAGRIEGSITYRVADGGDDEVVRTVDIIIDVERRAFWTGLTEPELLRRVKALPESSGGDLPVLRAGGYDPILDSTLDEVRDLVAEALDARGIPLDTHVGGADYIEPHLLLARAELATDAATAEALRERAHAAIGRKIKVLQLDTDGDGVVDSTATSGVGIPTSLGRGFTSTRLFTRSTIL